MKDTARVLGRMYDAIEYRGSSQHTVHQLAGFAGVPVVNGLTDDFHPTQMLADAPRELWPADDLVSRCEGFAQESGARITITGEPREAVRGVDFVHTDMWVGIEVTEDAFESPADIAFEQAENRMHTIRAVLVAALTRLR